jgi:hypothetical protein
MCKATKYTSDLAYTTIEVSIQLPGPTAPLFIQRGFDGVIIEK